MTALNTPPLKTMELLRFSTAGSVDDGKSTLIGRLLYDAKSIFEDTLDAIARTTMKKGQEGLNLALLTDGLQAEREQGITIDVAYRYFATPRRKFIIADTPGHEQYTRNMVTGASTSDLAIILVDARKGPLIQSRRHAYLSSLLGIRHLVIAVNKMDTANYSDKRFKEIQHDFEPFLKRLGIPHLYFIPMSALHGDMVVERGENLDWYKGPTLLDLLETVPVSLSTAHLPARLPVQLVCRPQTPELPDFRGYMGRIESGTLKTGEAVTILPSGQRSRIRNLYLGEKELSEAIAPQSIQVTLEDEIDISRGDMIVSSQDSLPKTVRKFDAKVCWLSETPLDLRRKYLLKHANRTVKAIVESLDYLVDINSLEQKPALTVEVNDIAHIHLKVLQPVMAEPYHENRKLGAFILIDESSNMTVAGGMIEKA